MQETNFIEMANNINNIQVYNKMYQYMNNFNTLLLIFGTQIDKSGSLLFVACQMLSKKLINHQILLSSDDIEESLQIPDNMEMKKKTLFQISRKLYDIITNANRTNIPQYITRSCINTISQCITATINSNSIFQITFINFFKLIAPDFQLNDLFNKTGNDNLYFVQANKEPLRFHHEYVIQILTSLLDYVINSTYFLNYYYFRRNLYSFRNAYLSYLLQYSIFCLKTIFKFNINWNNDIKSIYKSMRPSLNLLQKIIMYPLNLNIHQSQIQDEIHENIAGLQSQIYFPSYFRNLLCDFDLLTNIVNYYLQLNMQSPTFQLIREDIYLLIRIIGRILSTTSYIFIGESLKKKFRVISANFVTQILKQNKFYDSYLIMCISKINIKFMSVENQDEMFQGKKQYFNALSHYICQAISQCQGKIQDGDKHPYRQIFQVLTAFVNISANTVLDQASKRCAQETLNILLIQRLGDNQHNEMLMKEFGFNNNQEIQCFKEIYQRVPQIFKINLQANLTTLDQLNLDALNSSSLTFWLHLTALLLPEHDASIEKTYLILKFLQAAIKARSIASLHYIQSLVSQILFEITDGISVTYLWKFIEDQKKIMFQDFLTNIIKYAMQILIHCLELFKVMFTKLCKSRHQSFTKYFQIIQQVCREIDNTMLAHPKYIKLRIGFFSVISIIWINEGQINFVYRIFSNIRNNLGQNSDLIHFIRYMTDITGLLDPVQSAQMFKILMELILIDMQSILPFYLGSPEKIKKAFSQELFLKTFIRFLLTIVNDHYMRISSTIHTLLPLRIEETFSPYLIQVLNFDFPKKTVQTWVKFMKLNPLGKLLPLAKSLKQKSSSQYKNLLLQYFYNLHRLDTLQQFYYIYLFVQDNIDLMTDWWDQIMVRGFKPDINVTLVVNARIWMNSSQKEQLGRLLFRIGKYDQRYWKLPIDVRSQYLYSDWFVANYN